MENLLLKYMNERVRPIPKKVVETGPVITISRECGCSGSYIAEKLTERINKKIADPLKRWKWVSKEILNLASEELKINPDQIIDILDGEEKSFLDEIVFSFTEKYYVNDLKVKNAIEEVVRSIAVRGKAVIVGRGSEVLSLDIPRSLHIKLFAPMSWKIGVICERRKISPDEAKKFIIEVDKQRSKFRDAYFDKNQDVMTSDIEFNCAKFSLEEIIGVILNIAETKMLINSH